MPPTNPGMASPSWKPVASLVIPVFNSESFIARCLTAIRRLRVGHGEIEVIVVDNGSTDRTREIVSSHGFDCLSRPGVHVGAVRNYGAARARADLLAFIDSDVELDPGWLEAGVKAFENPRVLATGCFPGVPQAATWVQEAWDIHQRGRQPRGTPTPVTWLPSMSLVVRREDFAAVKGFDEALVTAEDVDLCYRLSHRGLILSNPAMQAVHWGEAPDLRTFWRKEKWRGISNLHGSTVHGLRRDELPSLIYPVYMIAAVTALVLATACGVWYGHWGALVATIVLAVLPAAALAANTARLARRPDLVARLFVLYLTYGLARAAALVRRRA